MERRRRRFPFSHPSRTNQFRDTVSIDLSLLARSSLGGFEIIFKIIYPLSLSFFVSFESNETRSRILGEETARFAARPFEIIRISSIIIY